MRLDSAIRHRRTLENKNKSAAGLAGPTCEIVWGNLKKPVDNFFVGKVVIDTSKPYSEGMSNYEIPEMPDYCHCSSNGECAYCLALENELELKVSFHVQNAGKEILFTGSLAQCRDFMEKQEIARRELLWVK